MSCKPLEILSLGAGVQSTALFILGCEGELLPKLDAAVFADTGWEPRHVYEHLGNLRQFGEEHGVTVHIASKGNLPQDVLNRRVFATIPAWTLELREQKVPSRYGPCPTCGGAGSDLFGEEPIDESCDDCLGSGQIPVAWRKAKPKVTYGMVKRQCTPKYKIEVINAAVRRLLGASIAEQECRYCGSTGVRVAPWDPDAGEGECSICRGSGVRNRVGRAPKGAQSRQWVGFSTDEWERITTAGFPAYEAPTHPLFHDLKWNRLDCEKFLADRGWQAEKSACLGCPYHDDDIWIEMKQRDPQEFEQVAQFDENPAFRYGNGLRVQRFLHEARIPLRRAVEKAERERLARGEQLLMFGEQPRRRPRGCSPYGCRSAEVLDS